MQVPLKMQVSHNSADACIALTNDLRGVDVYSFYHEIEIFPWQYYHVVLKNSNV
jgi:hypothetical protein